MGTHVSRRAWLSGAAALAGCFRKAKGYRGYAFVANRVGRSVAAVDLSDFTLVRQIALDGAPQAVIAHPAKATAYALAPEAGTIYEIEAATLKVTRRARVAQSAIGMRLAGDGRALWLLAREPRALLRVPLDSLRVASRIALAKEPAEFALDERREGRLAAVSFAGDGSVALCDLEKAAAASMIEVGGGPVRIAGFRKDGKHLLVASAADRMMTILEVASGGVVVRLPLPLEPAHFCFLPDGGQLFVSGPGMDAVVIVEPFSTQVGETMLAGRAPANLAVSVTADHSFLFVSNPEAGDVSVIDVDTRKLLVVVHAGMEPRQVLFTPDGQYALVLNSGSGDMAVIRIGAFTSGPNATWAQRHKMGGLFLMVPVGAGPVDAAVVGV